MRKIDRIKWIESVFGPKFVLEYRLCFTWEEIGIAITYFEKKKMGWGMRTDKKASLTQSYLCPFIYKGTLGDAKKIWEKEGGNLYYIVCENIPLRICSGVAELVDDKHIFIEFNDKDQSAQRYMYKNPNNLRHIGIGPAGYIERNGLIIRCFHPEEGAIYGFDQIYGPMIVNKIKEATFTVKTNRQVIIW